MEKQTYVSYFSPTGGTKRAALMLGAALPGASPAVEIDLSAPQLPRQCFTPDDVVIFAMPVFGGRLPALAVQKLAAMQGSGTKAHRSGGLRQPCLRGRLTGIERSPD